MINFIVWLILGAFVGWVASMIMKTDAQQGTLMNIIVGIVGAFLGGAIFNALGYAGPNINEGFSIPAVLVSLVGALILLAIINLVRRGAVR